MENAIMEAAKAYAEMEGSMTASQVLQEIKSGNNVVLRSVLMLMEVTA